MAPALNISPSLFSPADEVIEYPRNCCSA